MPSRRFPPPWTIEIYFKLINQAQQSPRQEERRKPPQ